MRSRLRPARSGFTLIEIITVVAIIGILASIVLVSLQGVKVKSRDARRQQDLDTIQSAVEQYYRDNGHYPITKCSTNGGAAYVGYQGNWSQKLVCQTVGGSGSGSFAQTLVSYIPTPLGDPSGTPPAGSDAGYLYRSDDGVNYCILIWRTPENMKDFKTSLIDMNRCGSIMSSGQCSNAGNNNLYYSSTPGATGC